MVPAPIEAPDSITTKGPIDTSAPITASCATELSGSTPLAGRRRSENRPTACAKDVYGSRLRNNAHGGCGREGSWSVSPTMTADARVAASFE